MPAQMLGSPTPKMTDEDKLELLGFIEDHSWGLLGNVRRNHGFENSDERLQTIERCQRIRANLRIQQSYLEQDRFDAETAEITLALQADTEPILVLSDDGERRYRSE